MRTSTANAVAQMILEARPLLGIETATHLVGNATGAYVIMEGEPSGASEPPLPAMLDALRGRVENDRSILHLNPRYPHEYPVADDELDALLERMAAVWDHRDAYARDMLREVERLHAELGIVFSMRFESGRWYVEATRPSTKVRGTCYVCHVRDDHPILEVALGEVLRSI